MNYKEELLQVVGAFSGGGEGGGEAVLIDNKDISANGEYPASADNADGYKKVTVDVPNTYSAGDEGKVVSNGELVAQTSTTVDANGTIDTTLYNSVTINVEDSMTEVTISDAGAVTQALDANKIYHFTGALTALTVTLNAPSTGKNAHYHFDFLSGSTAPTVTIPNTVTMPDGWTVDASKRHEVDILNNYATAASWAVS